MPWEELLTLIFSILGGLGTFAAFVWRKLIVPAQKFIEDHEEVKQSIQTIKNEVVTNGGSSIKDAIGRIEATQKVLDQRSKASLHYHNEALFETDEHGNLIWSNEKFKIFADNSFSKFGAGYDWITIIDEPNREDFLREFASCLEMCRKLDMETVSFKGNRVRFIGYPYKIKDNVHKGFLIHLLSL